MRAMSLVSSDGEGEQNEIRSLQEKLDSTMKLVANLSGQLTELKEQVSPSVRISHLGLLLPNASTCTRRRVVKCQSGADLSSLAPEFFFQLFSNI